MPQPIRQPCEIMLIGISDLPNHAQRLGQIVSLSGALESMLGHVLAYMTGASASVTIPMFHAVSSTDAQRAMLLAAAEQTLSGAELSEFHDLMEEFRTRYGERSRLVHNLWGVSPAHPGKAVWCHAKDATRISSQAASIRDPSQVDLFMQEANAIWKKCSLYTEKDMEDVFTRLWHYVERVRLFIEHLQEAHPVFGKQPEDDQPNGQQAIEPPQQ